MKLLKLLRKEKIYILPTSNGLKLFALNIILLMVGLFYANNFILFINFLLFSIFFCSLLYTHYNLTDIQISKSGNDEFYSNQDQALKVIITNLSSIPKDHINIKIRENDFVQQCMIENVSLSPFESKLIQLQFKPVKRGTFSALNLSLETTFPFHFFRSFKVAFLEHHFIVFPYPQMSLMDPKEKYEESQSHDQDFILRDYTIGDPLSRVHWKKSTHKLISKHVTPAKLPEVLIDFDLLDGDLEQRCSLASGMILKYEKEKRLYGLKTKAKTFPPNQGKLHKIKLLTELAGI
jgi:uncharacterized protein (DUF58 family)